MVKFDHMSLAANVRTSRDWYVRHLGFQVEFRNPGQRWVVTAISLPE